MSQMHGKVRKRILAIGGVKGILESLPATKALTTQDSANDQSYTGKVGLINKGLS